MQAGRLSRPLPHPLPSSFSPPFQFVQHGARNRIRLIEFSAFSQDRQLGRLPRAVRPKETSACLRRPLIQNLPTFNLPLNRRIKIVPEVKEPFSPHGRGLVTIVYVVKRSFQFDMKQDTCHVKGRKFTCKVWRTSWKRALNDLFAVL